MPSGDVAHLNTSSSCEDLTQNLTPLLEHDQGEASMYGLFLVVNTSLLNG